MHINFFQSIKKSSIGQVGFFLLLTMVTISVFASVISPFLPDDPSINVLKFPLEGHLLGTNDIGQDVFSRILYGARTSLIVAVSVGFLTVFLGALLGGSAALIGGMYERIIMRTADVLLTLPNIMVIILISAYVRPSIISLILLLSLINWQGSARIIRAQTLSLKNRLHIYAAINFGAGKLYILKNHIIPDMGPIVVTGFVQHARRAVFMEAGLAFLGISDPTMVSWGTMLNRALEFSYMNVWYWIIPPGIMLSVTVLSFSFLGYAFEQTFNPRLRTKKNA